MAKKVKDRRPRYSEAVKRASVERVQAGESARAVARDLGCAPDTITRWAASPPAEEGPATVADAVRSDLAFIGKRDARLAHSSLALTAVQLGREMDAHNSATSKSMCAKALAEIMDRLWAMAPKEEERDRLDELAERRAARRAGGAAT